MFWSLHSNDSILPKLEVTLVDKNPFNGITEFSEHPIQISIDDMVIYCRKQEAVKLHVLLGYALQELEV